MHPLSNEQMNFVSPANALCESIDTIVYLRDPSGELLDREVEIQH